MGHNLNFLKGLFEGIMSGTNSGASQCLLMWAVQLTAGGMSRLYVMFAKAAVVHEAQDETHIDQGSSTKARMKSPLHPG